MIRDFEESDMPDVVRIHAANELPENCLPDLHIKNSKNERVPNPLFVVKSVYEHSGQIAMFCFLKVRSELYLMVDHGVGTPEERWKWLQELKDYMVEEAALQGLDQMTCFVPPDIDMTFKRRLKYLGFEKSPWVPYSLNIE